MTHTRTALALAAAALAALATGCSSSDSDDTEANQDVAYTVTGDDNRGAQTYLDVEVETADDLEAVFDAVIADLDEDGGYFVDINCSTGATEAADNRLANGRYARGDSGAAATGLPAGESEFEPVAAATCPAE
ncbi:hypothetical protein [Streptomyces sp. NBC_01803]|uniref:hypothetical protein n=1 Tax=Streptomyces sp. NBC_01803 TaxID=2975946 RepID=UPI002DD9A042|nr:hypothetical protein [Streptomyces sp. NBC_01803]WSA45000.1 hypothetical protein OIE51_12720 [Streptomyces sp. NBC_01803]